MAVTNDKLEIMIKVLAKGVAQEIGQIKGKLDELTESMKKKNKVEAESSSVAEKASRDRKKVIDAEIASQNKALKQSEIARQKAIDIAQKEADKVIKAKEKSRLGSLGYEDKSREKAYKESEIRRMKEIEAANKQAAESSRIREGYLSAELASRRRHQKDLDKLRADDIKAEEKAARDKIKASEKALRNKTEEKSPFDSAMKSIGSFFAPITALNQGFQLISFGINSFASAAEMAIGPAKAFEVQLAKITTVMSDAEKATINLKSELISIRAKTGMSGEEIGASYYDLLASGAVKAADATKFLETSSKLARGGMTTLDSATKVLRSTISAYGLEAQNALEISDALFIAARDGATDVDDLSREMGSAVGVASMLGVSYKELVAFASAITTTGVTTSEAFTAINSAMISLSRQTDEMSNKLREMGIFSIQAEIAQNGFVETLRKVTKASGGSAEAVVNLMGRLEAVKAVSAATSESTGKKFDEMYRKIRDAAKDSVSATEDANKLMLDTLSVQIDRFNNQLNLTLARSGITKFFKDLTKSISDNIEEMNRMSAIRDKYDEKDLIKRFPSTLGMSTPERIEEFLKLKIKSEDAKGIEKDIYDLISKITEGAPAVEIPYSLKVAKEQSYGVLDTPESLRLRADTVEADQQLMNDLKKLEEGNKNLKIQVLQLSGAEEAAIKAERQFNVEKLRMIEQALKAHNNTSEKRKKIVADALKYELKMTELQLSELRRKTEQAVLDMKIKLADLSGDRELGLNLNYQKDLKEYKEALRKGTIGKEQFAQASKQLELKLNDDLFKELIDRTKKSMQERGSIALSELVAVYEKLRDVKSLFFGKSEFDLPIFSKDTLDRQKEYLENLKKLKEFNEGKTEVEPGLPEGIRVKGLGGTKFSPIEQEITKNRVGEPKEGYWFSDASKVVTPFSAMMQEVLSIGKRSFETLSSMFKDGILPEGAVKSEMAVMKAGADNLLKTISDMYSEISKRQQAQTKILAQRMIPGMATQEPAVIKALENTLAGSEKYIEGIKESLSQIGQIPTEMTNTQMRTLESWADMSKETADHIEQIMSGAAEESGKFFGKEMQKSLDKIKLDKLNEEIKDFKGAFETAVSAIGDFIKGDLGSVLTKVFSVFDKTDKEMAESLKKSMVTMASWVGNLAKTSGGLLSGILGGNTGDIKAGALGMLNSIGGVLVEGMKTLWTTIASKANIWVAIFMELSKPPKEFREQIAKILVRLLDFGDALAKNIPVIIYNVWSRVPEILHGIFKNAPEILNNLFSSYFIGILDMFSNFGSLFGNQFWKGLIESSWKATKQAMDVIIVYVGSVVKIIAKAIELVIQAISFGFVKTTALSGGVEKLMSGSKKRIADRKKEWAITDKELNDVRNADEKDAEKKKVDPAKFKAVGGDQFRVKDYEGASQDAQAKAFGLAVEKFDAQAEVFQSTIDESSDDFSMDMKGIFSEIGDGMGEWGKKIWNGITDTFKGVAEWFWERGAEIWEGFKVGLEAGFSIVKEVWNLSFGLLKVTWDASFGLLQSIWDTTLGLLQGLWGTTFGLLSIIVSEAFSPIISFFNGIPELFSSVWSGAKDIFGGLFTFDWEQMGKGFSKVFEATFGMLQNIWSTTFGSLSGIWDMTFGWLRGLWGTTFGLLQNLWSKTFGLIQGIWSTTFGLIQGIWNTTFGLIQGIWNTTFGSFQSFWNMTFGSLSSIVSTAFTPIISFFNGIPSLFSNLWAGVKDIFKGLFTFDWDALSRGFSRVFDTVFGAIMNPIKTVANAIIDMLNGLVLPAFKFDLPKVLGGETVSIWKAVDLIPGQIPRLSSGGMVPGNAVQPGDSLMNDRIMALLSPGEFVIPRTTVSDLMNRSTTAGGSGGGVVQNITVEISIAAGGGMTESSLKREIVPKVVDELRKLSQNGAQVLSKRGVY